jgi:hypothetical protein
LPIDVETHDTEVNPRDPELKKFSLASKKKESPLLNSLERFGEWHKMKRAVAIAIRYVRRLKDKSTPDFE